jgi:tRNA threonylcarbamoyladenosine biosynthesis protein TsaE
MLPAAADTDRLGRAMAAACRRHAMQIVTHGLQINLSGELGVGKTALVRAWLRELGVAGPVRSPSFAVLEPYQVELQRDNTEGGGVESQDNSRLDFYHFDFYRFAEPEAFSVEFRGLFGPGCICAIEWPEKAAGRLPAADLTIALHHAGDGRRAELSATSDVGRACLESTTTEFDATAAA